MKRTAEQQDIGKSRNVRPWVYILALLINVVVFLFIGYVYISSNSFYSRKLLEENIRNVDSLNAASANAALTYTNSMVVKINDMVSYIEANGLTYEQTVKYLAEANTDPHRQLQLILSGSYGVTGQLSFGDYSGISLRKQRQEDGTLDTLRKAIQYGSGYYEMFSCFTDVNDENNGGLCFAQEFTDPDTKLKCFAAYRHVDLVGAGGQRRLYTVLLVINSQTALSSYNMQSEYEGQSAVLVNADGNYIIKNNDYRNANFYDYIVNYNGLGLEWKARLQRQVREGTAGGEPVDLFYKNHQGADCVFSVDAIETGWYSITCVPVASFDLEDEGVNYSLAILLLFLVLFIIDGFAIFFVGRVMRYNIDVAERATQNAVSATQAKSRFLSTMSHELRTPLNAIIGLVALSEDKLDDPPVLRNFLKKIDISSKLLLQLISDILDMSAIESNKIKLGSSEFDIAKLITSLTAIYYDQCVAKGISFDVALRNMSATALIGDSVRVNQVLLNFLSNAVKYTPSGGRVTLRAEQLRRDADTALIRFEVEDTGCGISEELRGRLFRPFERDSGDTGRKYSGSGLGLSIAKNLVELMHGVVGVDSTEGVGACFWAEIPFGVPEDAKRHSFSPITDLRVLAVINGDDAREYIGQMLSGFGVEHELADDADGALRLLRERMEEGRSFDLCVLDWKMPDLDALEAAARIRASLGDTSPRIMVLAYDIADASARCASAGADYVFGKPVFPSAFYNTLGEIAGDHVEVLLPPEKKVDLSGRRVLLVEDNSLNVEIARMMLEKVGLQVETAEDGRIGSDMFIASPPGYYDAVLMDVQMPVMNGYQAARAIRASAHPQAGTVPILAMTADAFAEDVEKARKAGMNEHISKPVIPESLYSVLNSYLR